MIRIEKIRQMPDEELAEFLSKVAVMNKHKSINKVQSAAAVRNMSDVELANHLAELDRRDHLYTCTDNCGCERTPGIKNDCAECMMAWLREEGPLMDGEGA